MDETFSSDMLICENASNSNAMNQTHSKVTVEPKIVNGRKKRSRAWDHFSTLKDAEGNTKSKCNHCGVEYSFSSGNGTTNMISHLSKCRKIPHHIDKTQSQLAFQSVRGANKSVVAPVPWKFDQAECRRALCHMVIVDELPFSFVEKEGFRNFMKVAQPHFRIPSRSTITRDWFDLYNEQKLQLKGFFKETKQRVCITTDTWTSIQRINYMCITAHWIDKEWKLHKRILNFCPITSHKGEHMANGISKCLLEWGIEKIFTVTVDNASSNNVTVQELSKQLTKWGSNLMNGNHLHIRCMAHIINLVVQDGLKEHDMSVERIRHAVRYVRQSPARWKKFQECCEVEKISCNKALCLDVPTRWNSTYLMLNRAMEYENAFSNYCDRDVGLNLYLERSYISDGIPVGELSSYDWEHVKRVTTFLKIFYNLTLKVSGSLYITSNVHFLEICAVAVYLKQLSSNEDAYLAGMAQKMKEKFDKYWGNPEKMNKMIFISCILDPRRKFKTVEFALVKMFGEEQGKYIGEEVKKYMLSLFNEYVKSLSKGNKHSSSSPSSSKDTSTSGLSSIQVVVEDTELLDSFMQELEKLKADSGGFDAKTDLDRYLSEETDGGVNVDFDILLWWKVNSPRFPVLAEMARDVLAIPISSVASESAFSTGGRLLDSFRSSLTPKLVQILVCLQDWLRSEALPVSVEEDLDFLEHLEQDLAKEGKDPSVVDI